MPGLAMRFPRCPKCPAARTQNRNRCGRERSESVRVSAFGTNEGEQHARPAPGQDATALAAWAFAGLITLCSIVSSLVHGVASFEQAKASLHGVMAATTPR